MLDYNSKLDKILLWMKNFATTKITEQVEPLPAVDICYYAFNDVDATNAEAIKNFQKRNEASVGLTNYQEAYFYMEKLARDGYIDEIDVKYIINLNGIMFIDSGGYYGQQKLKDLELNNEMKKEKALKRNSCVIAVLTFVSVVSGIWSGYLTFLNNDKDKRLYDFEKKLEKLEKENSQLNENIKLEKLKNIKPPVEK